MGREGGERERESSWPFEIIELMWRAYCMFFSSSSTPIIGSPLLRLFALSKGICSQRMCVCLCVSVCVCGARESGGSAKHGHGCGEIGEQAREVTHRLKKRQTNIHTTRAVKKNAE